MGFIAEGNTLAWEDSLPHIQYIKEHGVKQFLHIYNNNKDRNDDPFKWGDEVEYILIDKENDTKDTKLSLRAHEILDHLIKQEKLDPLNCKFLWRPEYGRFMVEGTPGQPYQGLGSQLLAIETSLKERRGEVQTLLKGNESIITLACYPLMGTNNFTIPNGLSVKGHIAESQFLPDNVINPHFRFSTLTANIRKRRGENVSINIPMYKDTNTSPYVDQKTFISPSTSLFNVDECNREPYQIYMDAMGFGMGCCCLQTTFQLSNIEEARSIYDQLAVFSPIMLALTASSSIFKGYLSDIDARWTVISQSVDDRTKVELGVESSNIKYNRTHQIINKSRYDSIDCFISRSSSLRPEYNDLDLVYEQSSYDELIKGGVDDLLAKHIAHLFIRDPLVIYSDKIEINDEQHSDHFENIQSTNWQTVRFKPPPPGAPIGWRVEFRPMEVQLTDFENAAFIVFMSIFIKALSDLKLNLYLPISKVDENMKTAHKRNSVLKEKFYFRKNINSDGAALEEKMTIDEIFNGKGEEFKGLLPIVREYISKQQHFDNQTSKLVNDYLDFISDRASGRLMTMATWTRKFVTEHPAYRHDSIVSQEIQNDYITRCLSISNGTVGDSYLLGPYNNIHNN